MPNLPHYNQSDLDQAARDVQQDYGYVTSLDVKNHLRRQGFWAEQARVSQDLKDLADGMYGTVEEYRPEGYFAYTFPFDTDDVSTGMDFSAGTFTLSSYDTDPIGASDFDVETDGAASSLDTLKGRTLSFLNKITPTFPK